MIHLLKLQGQTKLTCLLASDFHVPGSFSTKKHPRSEDWLALNKETWYWSNLGGVNFGEEKSWKIQNKNAFVEYFLVNRGIKNLKLCRIESSTIGKYIEMASIQWSNVKYFPLYPSIFSSGTCRKASGLPPFNTPAHTDPFSPTQRLQCAVPGGAWKWTLLEYLHA